jgi:hypothetical protein
MTEAEIQACLDEIGDPRTSGKRRHELILDVFARGWNSCADKFGPDIPHVIPNGQGE